MSDFTQLLEELDELQALRKAHPEPDGDEVDGEEPENDKDEEEDDDVIEEAAEEKEMTKAMLLANGETMEFIDGTEMVKSLSARLDSQSGELAKALTSATELIKSMGAEIDALKSDVKRIAASGAGRKSAKTVPAVGGEVSGEVFMAKALNAQKAGRLSALQVSIAEGYLQRGIQVPDSIKNIVLEG